MQQLAKSPGKLAQAVSRIDSGAAFAGPEAQAAAPAEGASGGGGLTAVDSPIEGSPGQVMASPVKTKLQQVFEEYSRPRLATTGVREGDSTTTAEEDTTEEEGSSKYSM